MLVDGKEEHNSFHLLGLEGKVFQPLRY